MDIAVIGASGRTGTSFIRRALEAGHDVVAYSRSVERIDVDLERVTTVAGDAYTGTGLEDAIAGTDAVVCLVGHVEGSPEDLLTVVGDNVLDVVEETPGVDRYVTLVSVDVTLAADSDSWLEEVGQVVDRVLSEPDADDARTHVDHVVRRDVDWTVVRAARLTDEPPTGEYEHGRLNRRSGDPVSRADVSEFLLEVLEDDEYVCERPMVLGT